jgi:hypothetical protein
MLSNHNTPLFSSWICLIRRFVYWESHFEAKYPGIVIQAVGATFVTFGTVCLAIINCGAIEKPEIVGRATLSTYYYF